MLSTSPKLAKVILPLITYCPVADIESETNHEPLISVFDLVKVTP